MDELLKGQAEKMWREYADLIFAGIQVDQVQYEETRKAFYSGMFSCLGFVSSPEITGRSDDDGCKILDAFEIELIAVLRSYYRQAREEISGKTRTDRRKPPDRKQHRRRR
jgi:hypothetical protein